MSRNDNYTRQARVAEKRANLETSDADKIAWLLIAQGWRGMPAAPSRAKAAPGSRARKTDARQLQRSKRRSRNF
jgi:hypothetical protein